MNRTLTNTYRPGNQPDRARVNCAIDHGSPAVSAFDGILAAPTMWTKWTTRHLGTRST